MHREEDARHALSRLHPDGVGLGVDEELASMKLAIDNEAALARSTEIVDLLRSRIDRRRALLAVGAVVLQPASGASYIISKSFTLPSPLRGIWIRLMKINEQFTVHISSKWRI
jgi:hypothetical protein